MITESDLTILWVSVTAIDSVMAVFVRAYLSKLHTWSIMLSSIFTGILFSVTILITPIMSSYAVVLSLACIAMYIYNSWYVAATDDQLCEGLIWPKFRDYVMAKMQKVEDDADTMEAHSTHADRMDY